MGGKAASGCLAVVVTAFAFTMLLIVSVVSVVTGGMQQRMAAASTIPCSVSTAMRSPGVGIDGSGTDLSVKQIANAEVIVGIAMGHSKLREKGAMLGVAAALQESNLRNLSGGHADSRGLFQQRPSTGWGAKGDINDPVYAAKVFYGVIQLPNEQLLDIDGWRSLPPTLAIQAVQKSAYPDAYADDVPLARTLVRRAVGGVSASPLSPVSNRDGVFACPGPGAKPGGKTKTGEWKPEEPQPNGWTPRTNRVRRVLQTRFPAIRSIGGASTGGESGHVEGSYHYEGQALDVMMLPLGEVNGYPRQVAAGNRIASFLIDNQAKYAVMRIIWRARIWDADEAAKGWEPYSHPSGSSGPTLMHQDHLHVVVY